MAPFPTKTMGFDTAISEGLRHLTLPAPHSRQNVSLPALTLRRGSRAGLPTGQEVARQLGMEENALTAAEITGGRRGAPPEFGESTPLWYYLLREAELTELQFPEPISEPLIEAGGCRLGPIGSRIVAETIYAVLLRDGESVLHAPADWGPTLVRLPDGSTAPKGSFFGMRELLLFTGDWQHLDSPPGRRPSWHQVLILSILPPRNVSASQVFLRHHVTGGVSLAGLVILGQRSEDVPLLILLGRIQKDGIGRNLHVKSQRTGQPARPRYGRFEGPGTFPENPL